VGGEQRPDVDEVYLLATQLMTGRGGWPNSLWLTPEGEPFFAGTYFPREQFLSVLRRVEEVWRTRRPEVLQQAAHVAEAMRRHASRYTAASWALYLEAWRRTGEDRYRTVAEGVFAWVLEEMADEAGGFYSAVDADSEGVEGRFYLWTRGEILDVLGPDEGERFCRVYGVAAEGNVADEATGRRSGANVLQLSQPMEQAAEELGMEAASLREQMAAARRKLLARRNERVRPQTDDKVLAAWNGLMIGALARGGQYLREPRYIAAATRAADFVRTRMRRDGRPAAVLARRARRRW